MIGNLTRDPELRYTPQGTAVCTFGLATNRQWVTEGGERKEEVEFHRIVAWNKLAELCAQFLFKGRRIYIEGRLQTRSWTAPDGAQRQATEIVASDMIILDAKRAAGEEVGAEVALPHEETVIEEIKEENKLAEPKPDISKKTSKKGAKKEEKDNEDVKAEDIPF